MLVAANSFAICYLLFLVTSTCTPISIFPIYLLSSLRFSDKNMLLIITQFNHMPPQIYIRIVSKIFPSLAMFTSLDHYFSQVFLY